jgi:cytochrome c553
MATLLAALTHLAACSPSGDEPQAKPLTGCEPARDAPNPTSIAAVVDTVNALPKPVTLPCFIQHLSGPLPIDATKGDLSLQPAVGRRSPRIFIQLGPLIATIVPQGVGQDLLELGERRGETRSLKAEVLFPVTTVLDHASPYEHVLFDKESKAVTSCAFCHGAETLAPDITFTRAYESDAFRPLNGNRVSVDELAAEQRACDAGREPYRCAVLDALFEREGVTFGPLPDSFAIFQ